MKRLELLGLPVDVGHGPEDVVRAMKEPGTLLSYLNPLAWKIAQSRPDYIEHLRSLDIVVCDGLATRLAIRHFLGVDSPIITLDLSGIGPSLLESWSAAKMSICLVGGRAGISSRAAESMSEMQPGLMIAEAFSGFGSDVPDARSFILERRPDVVLAGMGMGLQESFLVDLKASGWNGSGVAVGAFFDRLAKPSIDYPQWSVKRNVKFLGNISRRPAYYLKRYLFAYGAFYRQVLMNIPRQPGRVGKNKDLE